MDWTRIIAEQRIKDAIDQGELDRLPGKGKPLPKDELDHIPGDLRMAYRLLKNAGFGPDEIEVRQEILRLEDLIRHTEDKLEKEKLQRQLDEKRIKYNALLSKKGLQTNSAVFKRYEDKIERKFFD